ncbi:MAG: glycosyltransferase family 1 protein, partial [Alphaproteobacteria bacterium]|nr:glycosyltransferase family 1 protein [Alphaproteobacteria bacterium]
MMGPLAYDLTHLVSRLMVPSPSGIDRVDLAFARHFAAQREADLIGLHLSLVKPRLMTGATIRQLVGLHDDMWRQSQSHVDDPALQRVLTWLAAPARRPDPEASLLPALSPWQKLEGHWLRARLRLRKEGGQTLPAGAIYVNVAQHVLDLPRYYQWLDERPDLKKVFFLHDLLPLNMPEYFKAGYRPMFDGVIDLMTRHASALITTTQAVKDDVEADLKRRGRAVPPILVAPLPSPLGDEHASLDPQIHQHDYFVTTGTIEPRKNHLLLLQVWRDLVERAAAQGRAAPRLVIIGKRGWENEQVIDLLERCLQIGGHVIEASHLSSAGLRLLLRNAR